MLRENILKVWKVVLDGGKRKDSPWMESMHSGLIFLHVKQNIKSAGENVGGDSGRPKHAV